MARYLSTRPGTSRLGDTEGVYESLKDRGRRLVKPQGQAGILNADILAVIRLNAVQAGRRGRGMETAEYATELARFDLVLMAVLMWAHG